MSCLPQAPTIFTELLRMIVMRGRARMDLSGGRPTMDAPARTVTPMASDISNALATGNQGGIGSPSLCKSGKKRGKAGVNLMKIR
jgi:hypothetical protein